MLLSLCENSTSATPSLLCQELEVSKSALAVALAELERQQYVVRIQQTDDGRYFNLKPKKAGIDLVLSLERGAVERFSAYEALTEEDVELVERWIRSAAYYYHIERRSLAVRRLKTDEDLNQARRAAVSSYLASSKLELMPSTCFLEQNHCFGLYHGKRLLSAVELTGSHFTLLYNFFLGEGVSSETARAFIARAADPRVVKKIKVSSQSFTASLVPRRDVCSALGRLFLEQD
jgi:DNA-binding MarR family transcriptional regulator